MKILQILVLISGLVVFSNGQSNGSTAVVTGNVYDQIGEVLSDTKITLINQKGERFETLTDENGSYKIEIPVTIYRGDFDIRKSPITKYKIRFENRGFKFLEIKEFNFVQNKSRRMQLDVALEVGVH